MQKSSLALFFLVMFAIGTDTFLISPLLPILRHEFHVSTASSGWMVSAYALGYALFALVAGPVSDRLNRKHVMVFGMAAFSISTGLCAAATGFWSMVLFRFLAGVSAAVISPQIWASIPILLSKDKILQGMGIATAGLSIAQMVGLPLGSFFAARNWSLPFIILGLFSLLLTLLLLFLLPSLPPRSPSGNRLSLLKPYFGLLSSRIAVTAFAAYFIFQIGNFAAFSFLGSWLSGAFGMNVAQIGQVMLYLGVGNLLGSLFGSRLSTRFGRTATLLLGIAVNSVMYPVLSLTHNLAGIKAELLVIFGITGILFPIMISILQSLTDTARGTVSALTNALMYLGTTIGAAAAGGIYQTSGVFIGVTLLTSLCFIISIFLFRKNDAYGSVDRSNFSTSTIENKQ